MIKTRPHLGGQVRRGEEPLSITLATEPLPRPCGFIFIIDTDECTVIEKTFFSAIYVCIYIYIYIYIYIFIQIFNFYF